MNLKVKNFDVNQYLPKFQEGGEMPAGAPVEGGAPAEAAPAPEAGGEDPMQQILMAAQQAVQTQDGQLALQVCQALVEMAGGGAPEQAPVDQAPVYRAGGKLSRWVRK